MTASPSSSQTSAEQTVDADRELLELVKPRQHLARLKPLLSQAGLKYVDLDPTFFGVGVGVAWSAVDFAVISILGGGSENQVMISCGVYRDVQQERLTVLDACNSRTREYPGYSVFLHDAEAGWDILVQQTFELQLLLTTPGFLPALTRNLPVMTQIIRTEFADKSVNGMPYRWPEDAGRLLIRSMV